jgi:acyl-coenzyme A thioesterase PaaI-like protein
MTTTPDAIVRNGPILDTYRAFEKLPFGGRWLFSRALCLKAPYFGSIRPRFDDLRSGFGRVRAPLRRAVKNHLGTFHAIACCNLAEVTAGTTLDASLPRSHRWIPKGMTVSYLAKATTDLQAEATVENLAHIDAGESREVIVPVDIRDSSGTTVVHADITMWVAPKRLTK